MLMGESNWAGLTPRAMFASIGMVLIPYDFAGYILFSMLVCMP